MKTFLFPALLSLVTLAPALAQTSPQVRPVAAFHAVKVSGGIAVSLMAGHTQRVEVSATTTEFRDRIQTTVEDGVLTIRYTNDRNSQQRSRQNIQLHVDVTADQLTALAAGSGSVVTAKGDFAARELQLDVASGSVVRADIKTTTLAVHESSGSSVTLDGQATSLDVQLGSGSIFSGKNLQTTRCRVEASSGSSVQVAVKEELVAQASSGSSISYSGSPQVTKQVSGGASVSGR